MEFYQSAAHDGRTVFRLLHALPSTDREFPGLPDDRHHFFQLLHRGHDALPAKHHDQRGADQKGLHAQDHLPAQPCALRPAERIHHADPAVPDDPDHRSAADEGGAAAAFPADL